MLEKEPCDLAWEGRPSPFPLCAWCLEMNPALFIGLLYQASSDKAVPNTNPTGALLSLTLGQGVAGKFTSREDSSLRGKKKKTRTQEQSVWALLFSKPSGKRKLDLSRGGVLLPHRHVVFAAEQFVIGSSLPSLHLPFTMPVLLKSSALTRSRERSPPRQHTHTQSRKPLGISGFLSKSLNF